MKYFYSRFVVLDSTDLMWHIILCYISTVCLGRCTLWFLQVPSQRNTWGRFGPSPPPTTSDWPLYPWALTLLLPLPMLQRLLLTITLATCTTPCRYQGDNTTLNPSVPWGLHKLTGNYFYLTTVFIRGTLKGTWEHQGTNATPTINTLSFHLHCDCSYIYTFMSDNLPLPPLTGLCLSGRHRMEESLCLSALRSQFYSVPAGGTFPPLHPSALHLHLPGGRYPGELNHTALAER